MKYEVECVVESAVRLAVHQKSVTELDVAVSTKTEMYAMLGYIVDFVKSNLELHKLDLGDEKYAFLADDDTSVIQFKVIGDDGEETWVTIYEYDNTDDDDYEICSAGLMLLNLSSVCVFDEE